MEQVESKKICAPSVKYDKNGVINKKAPIAMIDARFV